MDAISFVLGVKTKDLRGTQLKVLTHLTSSHSLSQQALTRLDFAILHADFVHHRFNSTCSCSSCRGSAPMVVAVIVIDHDVLW